MCGIVGRFNRPGAELSRGSLVGMTRALRHRGPDAEGTVLFHRDGRGGWRPEGAAGPPARHRAGGPAEGGFGHTRLSVIDLSPRGAQPMCNEDGTVWITYNGEVYNFGALRAELAALGHRFRSGTDTEVVVHAYEEWGTGCLGRFNGMFAFALFDAGRNRLFLARDRLGIKPLYYHHGTGCFAFASEPKALFACPDIPRVLHLEAVLDYLTLGYTPSPDTVFRGVRKLPPGHFLLRDLGAGKGPGDRPPRVESYWDVRFEPPARDADEEECAEELRRLLGDSVRMRTVSDVPLGAFLSGGVDSGAVVSLLGQYSGGPVRTFSIGFQEPEYSELPFARQVSSHVGTEHEERVLPMGEHGRLPEVLRHYDEPLADTSILPTWRLCALARERVTVCLSGDGGDELFGGYHQHAGAACHGAASRVPPLLRLPLALARLRAPGFPWRDRVRERLLPLTGPSPRECVGVVGEWSEPLVREILDPRFARLVAHHDPYRALDRHYLRSRGALPLDRIQYVDLKTYLPEDILAKVDRASMSVGLEVRVPFLDHRVVAFAASLPVRLRVRAGRQKYILKKAFEGILPSSILDRPKQGFIVPEAPWLRHPALGRRLQRISAGRSQISRFVLPGKIPFLMKKFDEFYPHPARLLWALIILDAWFDRMEREGGIAMAGLHAV